MSDSAQRPNFWPAVLCIAIAFVGGFIFAQFLRETDRRFPPIKGVLCASEKLHDFQKRTLSNTFGARVFSHYGHYEMAVLAGYCEHEDTYHV